MTKSPPISRPSPGIVKKLPLSKLRFDLRNPRYGPDAPKQRNDSQALDYIASQFDMSDVLSSISVNGFFESEPLVGLEQTDGSVTILEGNRRLAACLILSDDSRASNQRELRHRYPLHEGVTLTDAPVMVYPAQTGANHLLPYLGVRHIVGGKPWDPYAKAHWVAETLAIQGTGLTITEIKAMIGDTKGLTERLLSAYRLVQQLHKNELFDPDDSIKGGKGSASFPFALIYNMLDIGAFRRWLDFPEGEASMKPDPVPPKRLEDAAAVIQLICGSKKDKRAPAIKDSRQLRALSRAVQNPETYAQLKQGVPLVEVERELLPSDQRILENLVQAAPLLEDCQTVIVKTPPSQREAEELHPISQKVARVAISVRKALEALKSPASDDEDEDI